MTPACSKPLRPLYSPVILNYRKAEAGATTDRKKATRLTPPRKSTNVEQKQSNPKTVESSDKTGLKITVAANSRVVEDIESQRKGTDAKGKGKGKGAIKDVDGAKATPPSLLRPPILLTCPPTAMIAAMIAPTALTPTLIDLSLIFGPWL